MKRVSQHIRLPGLAALLGTLAAVAASPAILDVIPQKWSAVIVAISSIAQALTKPVPRAQE